MAISPKLDWQYELIHAINDPQELCRLLELPWESMQISYPAIAQFPLQVPRGFVERMRKGDPLDPLLRQVLPVTAEEEDNAEYTQDPLKEADANPIPGLLHKYKSRVLLALASKCAINCRYCFRRHFPYSDNALGKQQWQSIFAYIQKNTDINEVILSGGEPLYVNDRTLQSFSDQLAEISHVKRLRIHSRVPIALPERITPEFISWMSSIPQTPIMVTHCNHPQEINEPVIAALQALKKAGILLLNHTVLLKDVNDNVEVLTELSEKLFAAGVQPYYLNLLDKVKGAAHFDTGLDKAKALYRALSHQLPGYLLPRLTQEVPGEKAKSVIGFD
jgi:L-lysine 2,3-aminomutase